MIQTKMPWYQPKSNPLEAYALKSTIDRGTTENPVPLWKQALQALGSPIGTMTGGLLADRSFDQMDQNEALKAEYRAKGIPIHTDMYGNVVPVGGSAGSAASFFRGLGFGGNGGLLGSLGSGGGSGAPSPYYGGYVIDAGGNMIRSGDGFVTYGSGPQSSNVVSINGTTYDLSRD